ncbi:MAG: tRNA lysidine(34) synthetase TilS [Geodermatophilaceae bacterium]|nr:tRNA lysidine(34) synthetase TilS [Geodermatophilaceae bacterium]MDQ3477315.1 tRNA lysidine(34) synthetase TilS [Actinomycetota bacterium]
MAGPPAAVAAIRRAVRASIRDVHFPIRVACSGGADSLALAAAVSFVARRDGYGSVCGLTVDHGLQPDSAQRAATTATILSDIGLDPVHVLTVEVGTEGGPEAAARTARYEALKAGVWLQGGCVALGHTLDDQAETVLLGLGRGSGPRSIAGMQTHQGVWWRPLLEVPRATTVKACEALGLPVWDDPHNHDPAYRRVRLRHEVLPLLDDVLGGGTSAALARTATLLRADLDALDTLAEQWQTEHHATGEILPAAGLAELPAALRQRVIRLWLICRAVPELGSVHLDEVGRLITGWHGQGPIDLPGGFSLSRTSGTLTLKTRT